MSKSATALASAALMRTAGLITAKGALQFKTWDVDHGPTEWEGRDVWTQIDDHIKGSDVRSAAALLRNFLEYSAAELCDSLRAPVSFRGDAHYSLGDLLPPAISRLKKLYSAGKNVANGWGNKERVAEIEAASARFDALATASNAEQWQVNVAIHYNSWENLTKEDFAPVAKAYKELLGGFGCAGCGELLRVSPNSEPVESLRCGCGVVNINLVKKGA